MKKILLSFLFTLLLFSCTNGKQQNDKDTNTQTETTDTIAQSKNENYTEESTKETDTNTEKTDTIAQSKDEPDSLKWGKREQLINEFIDLVKNNNRKEIANRIAYPLHRSYPIPDIKNKNEFIKRYNQIFDDVVKKSIINSNPLIDWEDWGWRGIGLTIKDPYGLMADFNLTGDTLIIYNISYSSKFEKNWKKELINNDKNSLHLSLRNFIKAVYVMENSKYRIRIDQMDNEKYRYACWKKSKSKNSLPDLVITNGILELEGSMGNEIYTFTKDEHTYICYHSDYDDENYVTIFKDDEQLDAAKIIR